MARALDCAAYIRRIRALAGGIFRYRRSRSRVVFIQFLHALSEIARSLRAVGCC